ncbi:hypothetical protein N7535_000348 [Penicillium sp. DV-2018c]|nr:hypothetical protein N7535_000348 [Penicillium sp. DV-2018c]
MRSTYLLLSVVVPLASALVVPDETVLAGIVAEPRPAGREHDSAVTSSEGMMESWWTMMKNLARHGHTSAAHVEMGLLDITQAERGGWGGDGGRPDYGKPGHGGWGRHGGWGGHGREDRPDEGWHGHDDWPDYDERPGHGDWPGYGEGPGHDDWPDYDERPGYGEGPGYGGGPGHDDWPDDGDWGRHGDWPGYGEGPGHDDWPDDDERPGHDDWPDHGDWDRHGDCPGDKQPRPGHGKWPDHDDDEEEPWPSHPDHPHWRHGPRSGHRDDHHNRPCHPYPPRKPDQPRHGPIDACPGSLCKPEKTIWELIKESEHTSRLAELISNNSDLIKILNSTESNYTLFALTNQALDSLPRGPTGLSDKDISTLLRYHIVDGRVPIKQVSGYQTLSTKLKESALGSKMQQRIVVREHENGVILNRRSLVVGVDMKTKNGMIHLLDTPLNPPPETRTLLHLAPFQFSTFSLALSRTKVNDALDPDQRQGGTVFAPTNAAFRKLGGRVNQFLFSEQGEKCLRALVQYHIVPNQTLYSDVLYTEDGKVEELFSGEGWQGQKHGRKGKSDDLPEKLPKGNSAQVEFETLLEGKNVVVDVERAEGVMMRVNGFDRVERLDSLARDGVVHRLNRVLIPPKRIQVGDDEGGDDEKELRVEMLVKRLDGCVGEVIRGEL